MYIANAHADDSPVAACKRGPGLEALDQVPVPAYLQCHFSNYLLARHARRIAVAPCGCWLWTGAQNRNGYGYTSWNGRMRVAHRVVWEQLVGPIPLGKILDHVKTRGCLHRNCVNPAHLEPVTHQINVMRGDAALYRKVDQYASPADI